MASKVPEKHFIFNDGYCHVHRSITAKNLQIVKDIHPKAKILVHPECTMDVIAMADYVGSTSGIIHYVTESPAKEFIVCTEMGVRYELELKKPKKIFLDAGQCYCSGMKLVTVEKIAEALEQMTNVVELEEELRIRAKKPLERMLELG